MAAANSRPPTRDRFVGPAVLGAFLLAVGLVAVAPLVEVQLLQIPGYLLVVGSDLIQNSLFPRLSGLAYSVFFAVYLYAVAVVAGNLYRWALSPK
jgi:hypothetical protein